MNRIQIFRDNVDVKVKCPFCGHISIVKNVDVKSLTKYNEGEAVQRAFPTMSSSDRELIMTGMCKKCQDQVFKQEE